MWQAIKLFSAIWKALQTKDRDVFSIHCDINTTQHATKKEIPTSSATSTINSFFAHLVPQKHIPLAAKLTYHPHKWKLDYHSAIFPFQHFLWTNFNQTPQNSLLNGLSFLCLILVTFLYITSSFFSQKYIFNLTLEFVFFPATIRLLQHLQFDLFHI